MLPSPFYWRRARGEEGIAPAAFELLLDEVAEELEYGYRSRTLKAVLGLLAALTARLVASFGDDIISRVFVYVQSFLVRRFEALYTWLLAGSGERLLR